LHDRYGLPCKAIAALCQVRRELICRATGDIRLLLHQTGHTIPPSTHKLTTPDDLHHYATTHGIPTPAQIKTTL
jgi:hypothetical protein